MQVLEVNTRIFTHILRKVLNFLVAKSGYQQIKIRQPKQILGSLELPLNLKLVLPTLSPTVTKQSGYKGIINQKESVRSNDKGARFVLGDVICGVAMPQISKLDQDGHAQVEVKFPLLSLCLQFFPCTFKHKRKHILIFKWPPHPIIAIFPSLSLHIKFHMTNEQADINVWGKHKHIESLWNDAEQSEARKKLGYMS